VTGSLKLIANASVVDTEDGRIQVTFGREPSQTEPDLLGNLALLWRATPKSVTAARWNHVGDREAPGADAYDQIEVTFTKLDFLTKGLSLRAAVDDVLDDGIIVLRPSPVAINRLEFPGRRFWLQFEWTR
jgi:hypothetical protein